MTTAPSKLIVTGIALLALLLTACGDVSVNTTWPVVDHSSAWWWPNHADVVVFRTTSLVEPVEDCQRVRVTALSGSVVIVGEPGRTSIQLTANLAVGSDTRADARAGLDQMNITVTRWPDEIRIETDQPGTSDGRQYVVDYTLKVPGSMEVFVTQTNGNIKIEDMDSWVIVEAMNGNVQLQGMSGDIAVSIDNGNIDSTATLSPGGRVMLSTVSGDIDLFIPERTSATLIAFAGNGTINWHNLSLADISTTTQSLSGTLGSGAGMIDLDTVNGDIRVSGF